MRRSDTGKNDDFLDPSQFWEGEPGEEETEEISMPPPQVTEKARPVQSENISAKDAQERKKLISYSPQPSVDDLAGFLGKKTAGEKPPEKERRVMPEKGSDEKIQPLDTGEGRSRFLPVALVVLVVLLIMYIFQNLRPGTDEAQSSQPAEAVELPQGAKTVPTQMQSPPSAGQSVSGPGQLRIESDPPGAVVFIEGRKHGSTPTSVSGLPTGRQLTIRIEAEGYRPWEHKITIDSIMPRREIRAGLLPDTKCNMGEGWLHVVSEPKEATVEINGKRLAGSTPLILDKICAGEKLTLKLQKAGYRPVVVYDVMVAPGEVKSVTVELKK